MKISLKKIKHIEEKDFVVVQEHIGFKRQNNLRGAAQFTDAIIPVSNFFQLLKDSLSVSDLPDLTALFAKKQDLLVSGTNLKTINGETLLGSGDLEISLPPSFSSLMPWKKLTVDSTLEAGYGHLVDSPTTATLSLPPDSTFGDLIRVAGSSASGWKILLKSGQSLTSAEFGNGVGPNTFLNSVDSTAAVTLLCKDTNTFTIIDSHGQALMTGILVIYNFQDDTEYEFMDGISYNFTN